MNIEQVNAHPARWYTLLGLVLVPLLVAGGFLIAGLHADSSLRNVKAAIVNLDDPVTLDGKYIPLGRQLTANLVDSDRVENLDWVLQSEAKARAGLATGQYAAMVLIPKNFSAAATSYAKDADDAERATIQLSTSPVAGVADATLGKAVALAAASSLNETLTSTYLKNIYVGFNSMGKQFTTLADAAAQLSDGTTKLADGVGKASDGTQQLATGTRQLADGLGTMADKTSSLPTDTKKLASGVGDYVDGANQLAQQTIDSLPQQVQLGKGIAGMSKLGTGVHAGLAQMKSSLKQNAATAAATSGTLQTYLGEIGGGDFSHVDAAVGILQNACQMTSASASDLGSKGPVCVGILEGTAGSLSQVATGIGEEESGADEQNPPKTLLGAANLLDSSLATTSKQLNESIPDVDTTTAKLKTMIAGGTQLAAGTTKLADGMPALTSGIAKTADGADQLADGVDSLGAGLITAHSGASQLADGMDEFAVGIAKGKDKVPSYTTSERENLSDVVASPVATDGLEGLANPDVGWISLLAVLALWLGAMATYTVVRAIGRGMLGSSEHTGALIARSLLPGLAIVAAQALILAALVHAGLNLTWPKTFGVTGVLLIAAAAFAVLNHALVALAGGFGRIVALVFAVITAASTLVPAAPASLTALRGFSPLTPVLDAVRAVITESSGAAASTWVIVGWLVLGLLGSSIAIARKRTVSLAGAVAGA